mmetsp:Transcript_20658/g.39221  ORF Transcript_20658/g.39221 Transcript_20658/m.39221 type:complete len:891 (+) Transcript_20658:48-2720(+)
MPSGDVWLHPLHSAASGADAIPFFPISMHRKLTDVQALHSFAAELAHARHVEEASPGHDVVHAKSPLIWQVSLSSSGMITTRVDEAHSQPRVPLSLRFCEVVHASAGRQQLIAIGRRDCVTESKRSKQQEHRSLVGPFGEVWVLLVDGDDDVLQNVLGAMSALGAIRADFQSIYQLSDSPIGTGCCSSVHLGKRIRPAVKINLAQTILDETLNVQRPEALAAKVFKMNPDRHESQMVTAEAALLLAVQTHPNIVAYYGTFTMPAVEPGATVRWVMALEWCSRGDLHDYLTVTGSCKENRAADILVGLLAALAHVHSCGIVHRDVKAENILLGESGRPMLSDFGIAARIDDDKAMMQRCGSPGYAAPEILNSQRYDFKVDVFSAGVVLYFLLCSTLPFAGPDVGSVLRRTVRSKVKFPKSFQRVSNDMKEVILRLLQKEPEDRIDSQSALRCLWGGWCRDRTELPEWLRNRDTEFSGGSPCESVASSQVETVAPKSPSSSRGASMDLPAGAAVEAVKAKAKEKSRPAPFEIVSKKIENIHAAYNSNNSINSNGDKQIHQIYYSSGTCTDGTETTTPGTPLTTDSCHWQSEQTPRNSNAGLSFGDPLLSERMPDSPTRSPTRPRPEHSRFDLNPRPEHSRLHSDPQEPRRVEKPRSLSGPCGRFFRKMRTSSTPRVSDDERPPATDAAEAGQTMHSPRPPQAPRLLNRVPKYVFSKRESTGDASPQRGRRIFKPLMPSHNEGPPVNSDRVGQGNSGIPDDQRTTGRERISDTERLSSKEYSSKERITSRGWCTFVSDDSEISRRSFSHEHAFDDVPPRHSSLGEEVLSESEFAGSGHSHKVHADAKRQARPWEKLPLCHETERPSWKELPLFRAAEARTTWTKLPPSNAYCN